MKIALFYYIKFSGAKRVVFEQVKGLVEKGYCVDVYTYNYEPDIFDIKTHSSSFFNYSYCPISLDLPFIGRVLSDLSVFLKLKKIHKNIAKDIDARDYDIVLAHIDINTQAPFLLRFLSTKSIYYCLEPYRIIYERALRIKDNLSIFNKTYEKINRFIRKKIDLKNTLSATNILTISLFARERIIAAYDLYPNVLYLGVDEKVFRPLRVKKKNQILYIASREDIYGYDLLTEALDLIPKKVRPILKIITWEKSSNNRLSDEELVRVYNESLASISLSKLDTFGLIPLESMACEVPPIALNVAGYRESITNNVNGFLVDFDPNLIAKKMILIVENTIQAKAIGKSGRNWIEENWTWAIHIKKLDSYLKYYFNQSKKNNE